MKNLLIMCIICSALSCGSVKHYRRIHGLRQSGKYIVESVNDKGIKLKGVAFRYPILSDTIKVGDEIDIIVFKKPKK